MTRLVDRAPTRQRPGTVRRIGLATTSRPVLAALAVTALSAMGLACEPAGSTFVVTSTGDAGDSSLNGTCRTSAGECTLRAAIQEANHVAGRNAIHFSISGTGTHRIAPASQLPILSDPAGVTIDGYTQPGSAPNSHGTASNASLRVELQGRGPTSGMDGLDLRSPTNVVRGLAIWNFRQQVRLFGSSSHDNEVTGNFLGTNAAATVGAASYTGGSMGVHLQAGANNNRIGKPGVAHRNVISGNYQHGVATYEDGTDFNVIQNNIIGLRPDGLSALPNRSHGVDVNTWSADNLIGGTGPGERNVISGNVQSGVEVSHGSGTVRNEILGNYIGTTVSGAAVPAYASNGGPGVYLEGHGSPGCTTSCSPDAGFNVVSGNVIVNNARGVMIDKGEHDNVVTDNRIGVLGNGTAAGNRGDGVAIQKGALSNRIGPGNTIAYNARGVTITASGDSPSSPEEVPTYGNRITQNSIRNNVNLGIDLAPIGSVTAAPGTRVNAGARIPEPVSQSSTEVTMRTCAGCRVELFLADGAAGAYGEGRQFLTSTVADTTGTARLPVNADQTRGQVVTATSTDQGGSTSEFSRNVAM